MPHSLNMGGSLSPYILYANLMWLVYMKSQIPSLYNPFSKDSPKQQILQQKVTAVSSSYEEVTKMTNDNVDTSFSIASFAND